MPDGSGLGKDIIIFGGNNSSSVHIDNWKKDILVINKGRTDGLYDTIIIADAEYSINFTNLKMGATAFCLSMVQKPINWKQKIMK